MSTAKLKLFIIDDHPLVALGIKSMLQDCDREFIVSGNSKDIKKAIQIMTEARPDLILLDLFLGKDDPVMNYRILKKTFPAIPVIIISSETSVLWKARMFREGVNAFVSKTESCEEMLSLMTEVVKGNTIIPGNVRKYLDNKGEILGMIDIEIITELQVGFSVKQIAAKLGKSVSLIEKQIMHLRRNFNVRTNGELLMGIQKLIEERETLS